MNPASTEAHEGRHAAAGALLGIPLQEACIGDGCGWVTPVEWDATRARDLIKLILVGQLDQRDDWPPTWPSKSAATRDERQIAVLVEHLGLDRAGWDTLVLESLQLATRPDFKALETRVAKASRLGSRRSTRKTSPPSTH